MSLELSRVQLAWNYWVNQTGRFEFWGNIRTCYDAMSKIWGRHMRTDNDRKELKEYYIYKTFCREIPWTGVLGFCFISQDNKSD